MNQDQLNYKNFLNLCLQNGITVWADYRLLSEKKTTGHWNGTTHISVYRPNQKLMAISPINSSEANFTAFLMESPDVNWEMAILLHEYGHFVFKHPHLSKVSSVIAYQQEVQAWDKGEEIGKNLGMSNFSVFYAEKEKALEGYRAGLGLEKKE